MVEADRVTSPEPPRPPRRTTEEILAKAEEYAAIFESDDFDGVMMTPEEYRAYCAQRRADRGQ